MTDGTGRGWVVNYTNASCGHSVPAIGAPGSMARRAAETRHCGLPRCESKLPAKFTDRECAAYVWMWNRGAPWLVDLADKTVETPRTKYASLIEFAQHFGWDG